MSQTKVNGQSWQALATLKGVPTPSLRTAALPCSRVVLGKLLLSLILISKPMNALTTVDLLLQGPFYLGKVFGENLQRLFSCF
jgi:hypothetical protein